MNRVNIAKHAAEWKTAISSQVGPGLTEEILSEMRFPAAGGDFIAAAEGSIGPFLIKDILAAAGYGEVRVGADAKRNEIGNLTTDECALIVTALRFHAASILETATRLDAHGCGGLAHKMHEEAVALAEEIDLAKKVRVIS